MDAGREVEGEGVAGAAMIFKLDNDTIQRLVAAHVRAQGLVPVGAMRWKVERTADPRGDNEDMVTMEVAVRVDPELLAMRKESGP